MKPTTLEATELRLKTQILLDSRETNNVTWTSKWVFYWNGIRFEETVPWDILSARVELPCPIEVEVRISLPDQAIWIWCDNRALCTVDKELFLRNFVVDPTGIPIKKVYTCHNCTKMIHKVDSFLKELCLGN